MEMSRIERTRVDSGDTTSATELNNTYSDYTQAPPGPALDANNTRDQAFDIPHFTNTPIVLNSKESQLGNANMHITAGTITSVTSTTDLAALLDHQIQTAGALATFLDLSAAPWSLVSGDVFRLWWDLSVSPTFVGAPWRSGVVPTPAGLYSVPGMSGGVWNITDGMHCWVMYLEWDITSAALSTWVTVPNQTGFASTFGSDKGGYLHQTAATSTVGAWSVYSEGIATAGEIENPTLYEGHNEHGYYAVSGMWAYPATGTVTVYGVRVKLTGILHPSHLAAGNNENLLLYDINAVGGLSYSSGRISAVHMRGS
jgi:hypothetical protein